MKIKIFLILLIFINSIQIYSQNSSHESPENPIGQVFKLNSTKNEVIIKLKKNTVLLNLGDELQVFSNNELIKLRVTNPMATAAVCSVKKENFRKLQIGDNLYSKNAKVIKGVTFTKNKSYFTQTIQAESYYRHKGVYSKRAANIGSSRGLGWIDNNDYTEYKIEILKDDNYAFFFYASNGHQGGYIHISVNGKYMTKAYVDPLKSSSYFKYYLTDPVFLNLKKGNTVIRLTFKGGPQDLFCINWYRICTATALKSEFNTNTPPTIFYKYKEIKSLYEFEFFRRFIPNSDIKNNTAIKTNTSNTVASSGKGSLECTFNLSKDRIQTASFLAKKVKISDFSKYNHLLLDIFNPFENQVSVSFILYNGKDMAPVETEYIKLKSGMNLDLLIDLKSDFFKNKSISEIKKIEIRFQGTSQMTETILYIDNIRIAQI